VTILALLAFFAAALPAFLFLRNLSLYSRPRKPDSTPVSILIPARNEEDTIEATVRAALTNRAAEVVVLDDHSTDRTGEIVSRLAAGESCLRLVRGKILSPGWTGKNFACAQLAEVASAPLLLFLDADVRLVPDAAARMAAALHDAGADFISGVPRQETITFSEILLLPLIQFVLLSFLPLARMRRSLHPRYATGCGQLIMVKVSAYQQSNGHAGIRGCLHDGLVLPKQFRAAGFRTDLVDTTELATCRMYRSNLAVWRGLAKNTHAGLGAPARIVPFTMLLIVGQVLPFVLPGLVSPGSIAFWLAIVAALLVLSVRLVAARRFRQPLSSALLHPLAILSLLLIQWSGLIRYLRNSPSRWKGRSYPPVVAEAKIG